MEIWSKCDICGRDIPVGELCYGLKKGNCICKDCCTGFENCTFTLAPMPTLTPPNEWVSVYDRLPEPGERVLATDCGFVGEFYINKRGKWQRYNVNCSELLMALDILYWMPLPAPPDKDNHVPAKAPNEPLSILVLDEPDREYIDYICPRCKSIISQRRRGQRMETMYKCKFHDNCGQRVDWSNPQPYRRPPEGEENA